MRRLLILAVPVVALAGCAGLSKLATPLGTLRAGSFDCAPTDTSDGRHRLVSVAPNRGARGLDLKLESGQQHTLSLPAGGSDRLYSGPLYAWRPGGDTSVLTDVQNIRTYSCRPVGYGQAAALPATGRAFP